MAIKLDENSQGIAYGVSAYMLWGCFPLFFALFDVGCCWLLLVAVGCWWLLVVAGCC